MIWRFPSGVDELRSEPNWKVGQDLTAVRGRGVRLKFQFRHATLYSFQVGLR